VKYVDTNIFIRYLTQDDPDKSAACLAFFYEVREEPLAPNAKKPTNGTPNS
jgi:predicted nucleic acid-binding protein